MAKKKLKTIVSGAIWLGTYLEIHDTEYDDDILHMQEKMMMMIMFSYDNDSSHVRMAGSKISLKGNTHSCEHRTKLSHLRSKIG